MPRSGKDDSMPTPPAESAAYALRFLGVSSPRVQMVSIRPQFGVTELVPLIDAVNAVMVLV